MSSKDPRIGGMISRSLARSIVQNMGTRHLIAVVIDGDFKVAQYGQWDGYPNGQGVDVVKFLSAQRIDNFETFKAKVRAAKWITKEEGEAIDKEHPNGAWKDVYPQLSRDAGAGVLAMILNQDDGIKLQDTRGFAGDSLFCEWGYVIDFDTGVLEVYKGFNKEPTPPDSRFPSGAAWLEKDDKDRGEEGNYHPIALAKSYPLDTIPVELIDTKWFVKDFEEEDENA